MEKHNKIYIIGDTRMIGLAIIHKLKEQGCYDISYTTRDKFFHNDFQLFWKF